MIDDLRKFLVEQFPQTKSTIESVGNLTASVRREIGESELRPGRTVAGPVLMETADLAMYIAVLNEIGIVPMAVTTSLTINFLSKPKHDRDIIAQCTLLKVGKTLVVGEVHLYSEGVSDPVAHVVTTYAIPSRSSQSGG